MYQEKSIILKALKIWSILIAIGAVILFFGIASQLYYGSDMFMWFIIISVIAGVQIVLCMAISQILEKTCENGKKLDELLRKLNEN